MIPTQQSQKGAHSGRWRVKGGALPVPKGQMPHSSKHSRHPGHVKSYPFASPQRLGVESALGLWWQTWNESQVSCVASQCLREVSSGVVSWCSPVYHPACCFSSHRTIAGLPALHLGYICAGIKTPQCLPNRRWSLSDYFPGLGFQHIKRSQWMGMQLGELCESRGGVGGRFNSFLASGEQRDPVSE